MEIKSRVIRAFGLPEGVAVMELRCSEPGCPSVETNVVTLDDPQQYRLHKPTSEVPRVAGELWERRRRARLVGGRRLAASCEDGTVTVPEAP